MEFVDMTTYVSDDEELDDPITLLVSDCDRACGDRITGDNTSNNSEDIIDLTEDPAEENAPSPKTLSYDSLTPASISVKPVQLSTKDKQLQCCPLFIKIVDYRKHPGYYFKKHQTVNINDFVIIDEGIDFIGENTTENHSDDCNEGEYCVENPDCDENNMFTISPKTDPVKPKIRPVDISAYYGNINYVTPKPKVKALENSSLSSVKREIDKVKHTAKPNISEIVMPSTAEKDKHKQPIINNKMLDIDFRRNQGLVGLKITRYTKMQYVVPNSKCSKEQGETKLKDTQESNDIKQRSKTELPKKSEISIPLVALLPHTVQKPKDEKAKETLCKDSRDSQKVKCDIQSNKETKALSLKNSKSDLFNVVKCTPEQNEPIIEKNIASKIVEPNKGLQCENDVNKRHKYLHDTFEDTIRMFKETKSALLKEDEVCSKQNKIRKSKKELTKKKITKHNKITDKSSDGIEKHNEIDNSIMLDASNIAPQNAVPGALKKLAHNYNVIGKYVKDAISDNQNSAAKKSGISHKSTAVKTQNANTKRKLKNTDRNLKMKNSKNNGEMFTANKKQIENHQMMPDIVNSRYQLKTKVIKTYYRTMSNQPRHPTYHKDVPSKYHIIVQHIGPKNYKDVQKKIDCNLVTNTINNGQLNLPVVKPKSIVLEQVHNKENKCHVHHIKEATTKNVSNPTSNSNVVLTHGVVIDNTTESTRNARTENSQVTPNEPNKKLGMSMPTTSDPNLGKDAIDNTQQNSSDDVKPKIEVLKQVRNYENDYRFQYNVPKETTIDVINSMANPKVVPTHIVAINKTTETVKAHTARIEKSKLIPNESNNNQYILNPLPLRTPTHGNSPMNVTNGTINENGNSNRFDLAVNINNNSQPTVMKNKMDLPNNMNNNKHNLHNTGNFYMYNPQSATNQNHMMAHQQQYRSQYHIPQGRPIQTHPPNRYPSQNLYNVPSPYSLRMVGPTRRPCNIPPHFVPCAAIYGARPENNGLPWNRPRGPPPLYAQYGSRNGMWNMPPPPPPPPPPTSNLNQRLSSPLPPRQPVGPLRQYRYEKPVVNQFRTVGTGNNIVVTHTSLKTVHNKTTGVGNNNYATPAPSIQNEKRNVPSVIVRNESTSFQIPTIQHGSVITKRDNGLVPVTRSNTINDPKILDGNNQILPRIQANIDDRVTTNRNKDSVAQSSTTDGPKKPINSNSLLSSPVIKTPEEQTIAVGNAQIASPRSMICEGSTILGQNNDGFIRTINIAARTPSPKDLNNSNHVTTVTTKLEMFEELMNDVKDIECPDDNNVKKMPADDPHKELKRILTIHGTYKPGPLCKKPKICTMPAPKSQYVTSQTPKLNTGYSPPILPIPTYENTFELLTGISDVQNSRLSPIIPDKNSEIKHFEGTEHVEKTRKRQLVEDEKRDKSVKKISLDDYKRKKSIDGCRRRVINEETCRDIVQGNDKIKHEFGTMKDFLEIRLNSDLDLGYDSDSTVKL